MWRELCVIILKILGQKGMESGGEEKLKTRSSSVDPNPATHMCLPLKLRELLLVLLSGEEEFSLRRKPTHSSKRLVNDISHFELSVQSHSVLSVGDTILKNHIDNVICVI